VFDALPDTVLRVSLDGAILDYRAPDRADPVFHEPPVGALIEQFLPGHGSVLLRQALSTLRTTGTQALHFKVDAIALSRSIDARVVADGDVGAIVFLRDVTGNEWLANEDRRHKTREEIDEAAERRAARGNTYSLTFREFTVLDLMRSGASDKELAATLGISTSTASKHVSNVLSKMGVGSRTEAVAHAMSEGLLD
jgi:DNA-binding NarL/FixJ family response regulator